MDIDPKRFEEMERVRVEGQVNMLNRTGVQVEANRLEFYHLVIFIEDNKKQYAEILRQFGEWLHNKENPE